MTDREKLIELIVTTPVPCMVVAGVRGGKSLISASVIADHLLANGVTFATDTNVGSKVETNVFDINEIHHNCTVHILKNSITGEQSIGWWPENNPPEVISP